MKKLVLICLLSLIAEHLLAQKWPSEEFIEKFNYEAVMGQVDEDKINHALTPPMYPNGTPGILTLIREEIRYPKTRKRPLNDGKVVLSYVIKANGYITDIKVLESAGKPYDIEAIRVLKKMKRWIPGNLKGRNVRVAFTQSIRFQ